MLFRSKSRQKSGSAASTASSFIVPKIPFVGLTTTSILPFVGHNAPFERFGGQQRGFTLMELMIALVILGILAGLAAPGLRDMTLNNRLVAETNDLLADILFMRSEAIKRSTDIYMCKTANPAAASPVCDTTAANPWSTGWLIYVNGDAATTFSSADTLLRVGDGFSGDGSSVTTDTAGGGSNAIENEVIYSRLGLWSNGDGTNKSWFNICDSRGAGSGKRIEIALTGRPRVNKTDAPTC